MSRQIHVTRHSDPRWLATRTLAHLDEGEVVWVGRRQAPAIMRAAVSMVSSAAPDVRGMMLREKGETVVVLSTADDFTGAAYFTTSRPERYTLHDVDGELVALPAEDPAA